MLSVILINLLKGIIDNMKRAQPVGRALLLSNHSFTFFVSMSMPLWSNSCTILKTSSSVFFGATNFSPFASGTYQYILLSYPQTSSSCSIPTNTEEISGFIPWIGSSFTVTPISIGAIICRPSCVKNVTIPLQVSNVPKRLFSIGKVALCLSG